MGNGIRMLSKLGLDVSGENDILVEEVFGDVVMEEVIDNYYVNDEEEEWWNNELKEKEIVKYFVWVKVDIEVCLDFFDGEEEECLEKEIEDDFDDFDVDGVLIEEFVKEFGRRVKGMVNDLEIRRYYFGMYGDEMK